MRLAFCASRELCIVSFTRYNSEKGSHSIPKAASNAWHESRGSQICGIVESINERIGTNNKFLEMSPRIGLSIRMDWIPTTKSRELSGAKLNNTLLDLNLKASYPPRVKLPRTFFNPYKS